MKILQSRIGNYLVLPVLAAAGIASYVGYTYQSGNFHIVVSNEAYRSGQLSHAQLLDHIERYHIQSVLNLRGVNHGANWYEDELGVAKQLHVQHFDIRISANREASPSELEAIMAVLRDAPKPILVHCKAGSDRTGLIAALYLYSRTGVSAEKASRELSILFGHIPWWNSTASMDRAFWRYVETHPQKHALRPTES